MAMNSIMLLLSLLALFSIALSSRLLLLLLCVIACFRLLLPIQGTGSVLVPMYILVSSRFTNNY